MTTTPTPGEDSYPERTDLHSQLCDLSQEIGLIAERNWHYTWRLARRLQTLGKPLPELTLQEFLDAAEAEVVAYNQEFSR